MQGLIDFSGTLSGAISGEGGGGDVPVITATATVDNNTGTPECSVTRTGTDENPNFNFAFKNIKGATGATGANGQNGSNGVDGISPTVEIDSITGGTRVTISDAEHPSGQTFDVMNGQNGQNGSDGINGTNGISPTVSIATLSDPSGHAVTITDATHPSGQTFNVMDGERGQQGIQGIQGEKGDTGAGLPIGGNIGQIIQKSTVDNFATEWVNNSAGIQSFDNTNCEIISHSTTQLALEDLDAECYAINSSLTQKTTQTENITAEHNTSLNHNMDFKRVGVLVVATSYDSTSSQINSGVTVHTLKNVQVPYNQRIAYLQSSNNNVCKMLTAQNSGNDVILTADTNIPSGSYIMCAPLVISVS